MKARTNASFSPGVYTYPTGIDDLLSTGLPMLGKSRTCFRALGRPYVVVPDMRSVTIESNLYSMSVLHPAWRDTDDQVPT